MPKSSELSPVYEAIVSLAESPGLKLSEVVQLLPVVVAKFAVPPSSNDAVLLREHKRSSRRPKQALSYI